jgi:hypothetical protein
VRSSGKCLSIVDPLWEVVKAWREDLGYVESED